MKIKQRFDNQNTIRIHSDAARSKTLFNGLTLLEHLSERGAPAGVRDLSRELDFNPALVQRLLNTLAEAGFVEQEVRTRRYRVGPKALRVGRAYMADGGLLEIAGPILFDLSETMLLNTYLGVRSGNTCIYLIVRKSPGKLSVNVAPGDQVPLYSTAMGKALLSDLSDEAIRELIAQIGPRKLTAMTRTDADQLIAEIRIVRAGGAAISDEENIPGNFAAGAPIRDSEGHIVAAISGACAAHEIDAVRRERICEAVLAAATQISRRLGAESMDGRLEKMDQ